MANRSRTHRAATMARREALLRACLELVAEHGVAGVTHRAVAARAGLPPSTTSYFFDSIDELMLAALRHFASEMVERYQALVEGFEGEDAALDEVLERFIALMIVQPPGVVVAQFEAYLEVTRRPDIGEDIAAVLDAFTATVAAALAAAGVPDPRAAAPAFVALADGYTLQRLVYGEADPAAITDAFRRLLSSYQRG